MDKIKERAKRDQCNLEPELFKIVAQKIFLLVVVLCGKVKYCEEWVESIRNAQDAFLL